MKKFGDIVINKHEGKSFFVSTVPVKPLGDWFWQTAVFKQRFGPFAGLFRPVIFLGSASEQFAKTQHDIVAALVSEVPPARWDAARDGLAMAIIEKELAHEATDSDDFFQSLMQVTGGMPK